MVKRLEMNHKGLPEFDENGTWVFFSDYHTLEQKLDAMAAENAALKSGVTYFACGSEYGFDLFKDKKSAIDTCLEEIELHREGYFDGDGWGDEVRKTAWGIVVQSAQGRDAQGLHTSDSQHTYQTCDYRLEDEVKTPATDAYLNSVRAEGIHFAANRMLAAWECGFINDTPEQAHDISGAVLSALEFLPNASPEEFKRDYADEVRASIAASLRSGTHDTADREG